MLARLGRFFHSPLAVDAQRAKRLAQLLFCTVTALILLTLLAWVNGRLDSALVSLMGVLLLAILLWPLRQQQYSLVAAGFIAVVLAAVGTHMWLGSGLRSVAVLALPGVLVFAALMGSPRLLSWSLVSSLLLMLLLFTANVQGWRPSPLGEQTWQHLLNYTLVFAVIAIGIKLLAEDLLASLYQLQQQITKADQSQELNHFLTSNDLLTGLPNRSSAIQTFNLMQTQRDSEQQLHILILDIDHFKRVNNSQGTLMGDKLLRLMAATINDWLQEDDQAFRIGADDFLILLKRQHQDDLTYQLQDLLSSVRGLTSKLALTFELTASVGMASWPKDALDYNDLFYAADLSLAEAKKRGRDQIFAYQPQLRLQQAKDNQVLQDLQRALVNGQLEVHYQPIVDLQTGRVSKCEALLRWQHPQYGNLSPSYFVALAESTGLIHELGDFVLQRACRDLATINQQQAQSLTVCVNVSATQLIGEPFVQRVLHLLAVHHLTAEALELEITEQVFAKQQDLVMLCMRQLSAKGVGFAIDDFGTGYSNLANLQRFEVNTLKIDRSFVYNLQTNANNRALLTAIVQMALSLRLQLIAEGIECFEEARFLTDLGCHMGQGYLWSKAQPLAQLLHLLTEQPAQSDWPLAIRYKKN